MKKHLLFICFLFFSTQSATCNNETSLWKAIFDYIFGQKEQFIQNQPEQIHFNVTIEDYLNQFEHDLNGSCSYNRPLPIPQKDVDEMKQAARAELRYADLRNKNYINQKLNSIIIAHVKNQTTLKLNQLEQQGLRINSQQKIEISNSMESNVLARLSQMPHLEGMALAQFFGDNLEAMIRQRITNTIYQQPTYQNNNPVHYAPLQPTPSAPAADTYSQPKSTGASYSSRQIYATQHSNKIEQALVGKNIPQEELQKLKTYLEESTLFINTIPADDFLAHTKNSLSQLLDHNLEEFTKTAGSNFVNYAKLKESIDTTRAELIAKISSLKNIDAITIKQLYGADLEATLIKNAGIECSCGELFSEEHCQGTAHKIKLANCPHAICSECAPHYVHGNAAYNNVCPECRTALNKQDIQTKLQAFYAPTN